MTEAWTPERLFEVYFRPAYPPDLRRDDAALARARSEDANPARNPRFSRELDEIARTFAKLAPGALDAPDLVLSTDDASVHRLDAALTRARRDALVAASRPGDPEAPIVTFVVHAAVFVGECVVKAHGGTWQIRRPLWESVVRLESRAGIGDLAPFAWVLRALSDGEVERGGLASRYRQHVERATARPEELPPIVTANVDRKLPPLRLVRYDTLHKWLVAHLPEMRDLGRDFPSPEKLDELGFLSLEFLLLGEGRMLLMHGRARAGLHLFWLDHRGFSHAAFFPADPGAPHAVSIEGDRLVVRYEHDRREQTHEMLWWG